MTVTQTRVAQRSLPGWIGGVLALGIAAVALLSIWGTALPVTPPGTVCAAIYPPSPGCAGDARLLPATVWTVLIGAAVAGSWLLSRRAWWGVAAGALLVGAVGFAGYLATLHMNVLVLG